MSSNPKKILISRRSLLPFEKIDYLSDLSINKKKIILDPGILNKAEKNEIQKYNSESSSRLKLNKDGNIKILPYNFKFFNRHNNKIPLHKSLSQQTFNKKMESNFMQLGKEANIYTANAAYIKNKKMLIFDKYKYDNNEFKPDRAKLFDMTRIPNFPNKNSFIYKTTKFRAGHFIDNNMTNSSAGINSLYTTFFESKRNKEKANIDNCMKTKNISSQITKLKHTPKSPLRRTPSHTLYNQLIPNKKSTYEEIFKNILSNQDIAKDGLSNEDLDDEDENKLKENTVLNAFYKTSDSRIRTNNIYYRQINSDKIKAGYYPLLSKKKNKWGQPFWFPKIYSCNIIYDNLSQKERYEKITESFYNLKIRIQNFKGNYRTLNELDLIYEYCSNNRVEQQYLTVENLNNFYNFLNQKRIPVDTSKSLKENIILALHFEEGDNAEEIQDFSEKKNYPKKGTANSKNKITKSKTELNIDMRNVHLYNDSFFITNKITLKDEAKKELDNVKKEVDNKQKMVQNCQDEIEQKMKGLGGVKKISNLKNYQKLFDYNNRLYYTWYRKNHSNNIDEFIKKLKLTELIYYSRVMEGVKKRKLVNNFFSNINIFEEK